MAGCAVSLPLREVRGRFEACGRGAVPSSIDSRLAAGGGLTVVDDSAVGSGSTVRQTCEVAS